MSIILANDVSHTYGSGNISNNVIENLNFEVNDGEIVSIMGKSGAGKTTLLKILSGLMKPTKGEVIFQGRSIYEYSQKELCVLRRRNFGFVFQDYQLMNEFSAYENVIYPLLLDKKAVDKKSLKEIFDLLEITDKAKRYPNELSGGEQQRVAIARALVTHPKILFCDEPTGNLDSDTSDTVMRLLKRINDTYDTAILIVTHDNDIAKTAGRIAVIREHSI